MNESASRPWFARRTAVWILCCGAVSLLVATLAAAPRGAESDRGGASPYTPTRGEWLCLSLNSRQALMNSERAVGGVTVHFLYDPSRPDVIRVQALFDAGIREEQVQQRLARAEHNAIEAAKARGWENWLKIEREERKVTNRFDTDALFR